MGPSGAGRRQQPLGERSPQPQRGREQGMAGQNPSFLNAEQPPRVPPRRLAADPSAQSSLKRQQPPGPLGSGVGSRGAGRDPVAPGSDGAEPCTWPGPVGRFRGAPGKSPVLVLGGSRAPCPVPWGRGAVPARPPARLPRGHGDAATLQPLPGQGLAPARGVFSSAPEAWLSSRRSAPFPALPGFGDL